MPSPIPFAPPVTTATRPVSEIRSATGRRSRFGWAIAALSSYLNTVARSTLELPAVSCPFGRNLYTLSYCVRQMRCSFPSWEAHVVPHDDHHPAAAPGDSARPLLRVLGQRTCGADREPSAGYPRLVAARALVRGRAHLAARRRRRL